MTQVAVVPVTQEARQKEPFNPNEHLMQIKNKQGANDYLPVQWRLVWFRELCPQGTIETELVTLDLDRETEDEVYVWNAERRRSDKVLKRAQGYALFKAIIKDGKGGMATGYKSEKAASFPDYIEKAETGSIGRALAALGYGTQFAPELDEQHRIVDAPVEQRQPSPQEQKQYQERRTVVEAVPSEGAEKQNGKKPVLTVEQLRERAKGLYELAVQKGQIKEDSTGGTFLKLACDVCQVKIASIGQLTISRLDAIEKYLESVK
jgi:hypothetical protein